MLKREEYTNQHGAKVPTETTALMHIVKEKRKRVRNILRQWGRTDRGRTMRSNMSRNLSVRLILIQWW